MSLNSINDYGDATQGVGHANTLRREKHVELAEAIRHIGDVRDELQDLIDRVQGQQIEATPQSTQAPQIVPSLQEMLDSGPEQIHAVNKIMLDMIRTLREMLF